MTPNIGQNRPGTGWKFDNSYARLPEAFYARLNPIPVRLPKLVVFNVNLAQFLGLNPNILNNDQGAAVFSGNRIPEGAEPLAQAYAGHQFSFFTMLGDGRAILLGERSHRMESASTSSTKGPARPRFRGRGTGGRPWGRCFGSTSSVRPFTPWAYRQPAVLRW